MIVVISIISIVLVFSFPVFRNISLFSDSQSHVEDIIRLINNLKKRAVGQQVDFQLNIDSDDRIIWVTSSVMDDEAKESAKATGARFSDNVTVLDIEFPGTRFTGPGVYRIRFLKQGYSDFALIHIIDDEENITLKIEPFLSQVDVLKGHVSFDDCI